VPDHLATHNNLPPSPPSPLFNSQDLPSPQNSSIDLNDSFFSQYYTPYHSPSTSRSPSPPPSSYSSSAHTPSPPPSSHLILPPDPIAMSSPMFMPAPGSHSAPVFDPAKPRELTRYFDTLEFLLSQAKITDELEKIKAAVRYVDVDVSLLWRTAASYSAVPASYEAFKTEVIGFYPDADISNMFTIGELLNLVSQTRNTGIHSVSEAGEYHRKFMSIAAFLKSKGRLSELEANREFVRGYQEDLWNRISVRLQLTDQDHHPDDPWPVAEVHKAACFLLRGTSVTYRASSITPTSIPFPQPSPQTVSSPGIVPVK
ncbi:hypothetical protein CVT24_000301, partial [Panaeolus cyanescens]